KEKLPRGDARSLVDYLVHHPDDFRGAVARLRPELQGLYLSAFQSDLWNRMLAVLLTQSVPAEQLRAVPLKLGDLPVPVSLNDTQRAALRSLAIPLPAARWPFDPAAPWAEAARTVLAKEGLAWA